MTAMAGLPEGARVRHVAWGDEGTVLVSGRGRVFVQFDDDGPPVDVEPEDLEIAGRAL